MRKILIVEDSLNRQQHYAKALAGHTLFQATTSGDARALVAAHLHEIDVIILDGFYAPNDQEETTVQLARDIRSAGFTGPMIAASSSMALCKELREAGCNRTARKNDINLQLVEYWLRK